MRLPFVVGIVVSAIVGAIVIGFFLKYLRRNTPEALRVLSDYFWHNSNRSGFFPLQRGMKFSVQLASIV